MTKPHLLITRSLQDARPLRQKLTAIGYKVSLEPVIKIQPVAGAAGKIKNALKQRPQAILITSRNALRVLSKARIQKTMPLLVVGTATAAAAKEMGFSRVKKTGNTAEELCDYVIARVSPAAGRLFYPAGKDTAFALRHTLRNAGFSVQTQVVYKAKAKRSLSSATVKKIAAGAIDGILFFSPRSAEIFWMLASRAKLCESLADIYIFGLSKNVLAAVPAGRHFFGPSPSEKALITHIKKILPVKE